MDLIAEAKESKQAYEVETEHVNAITRGTAAYLKSVKMNSSDLAAQMSEMKTGEIDSDHVSAIRYIHAASFSSRRLSMVSRTRNENSMRESQIALGELIEEGMKEDEDEEHGKDT